MVYCPWYDTARECKSGAEEGAVYEVVEHDGQLFVKVPIAGDEWVEFGDGNRMRNCWTMEPITLRREDGPPSPSTLPPDTTERICEGKNILDAPRCP